MKHITFIQKLIDHYPEDIMQDIEAEYFNQKGRKPYYEMRLNGRWGRCATQENALEFLLDCISDDIQEMRTGFENRIAELEAQVEVGRLYSAIDEPFGHGLGAHKLETFLGTNI
jgi:hypothetical protein